MNQENQILIRWGDLENDGNQKNEARDKGKAICTESKPRLTHSGFIGHMCLVTRQNKQTILHFIVFLLNYPKIVICVS